MPKISLCIPCYNTETTLLRALKSTDAQDFDNFEIIVVNDCSPGKDCNGNSAKKIIRSFEKECKRKVLYIEHSSNMGLVETRRTMVGAASGNYICFLDSDDELLPSALSVLHRAAVQTNADIVHAGASVFYSEKDETLNSTFDKNDFLQKQEKRVNTLYEGEILGHEILDSFLLDNSEKKHSSFLFAKLFTKELYQKALSFIPFTKCVMHEDVIQYVMLCLYAKKYFGLKTKVYNYSIDTGISSHKKITSLQEWEKVCSASGVYTSLFSIVQSFEESPILSEVNFTHEQIAALKLRCQGALLNNLKQFEKVVDSSIKDEAFNLLCEYWGTSFVKKMQEKRGQYTNAY